jgi:hypothetical protein
LIEVFPILGQATAAIEPGDGALDNPAFGQDEETLGLVGAFDDFDVEPAQRPGRGVLELRPLITAIGIELAQEREPAEQAAQQQRPAVTILNVGRMNDGMQQQTLRVYQDMALLALDLLARVIPVRIDRGPPFSALLTLWLSMIAAVGLASRPACSRHFS